LALVLSSPTRFAARRSAFEIRMDILRAAEGGWVKPTHIMYRSNTSWIVLRKNLESLVASGFMRQSDESPRTEYALTQSGMELLRDYVKLVDLTTAAPMEVSR
jgi:predicted transcriptional regulator